MSRELGRELISIVRDLGNDDEEIRRLAVERLLTLPASEAIPFLIEGLGDPSWRVRKAAVERLNSCAESEQVVRALVVALSDGDNPGRRNAAVEALIQCAAASISALVEALGSADVDVRKLAVDALAGIGDESTRDALAQMLCDPDLNVRAAAADALGVIGGPEVPGQLSQLALDPDQDRLVRLSALRALAQLEVELSASELDGAASDPVLRPAAFSLLGFGADSAGFDLIFKSVVSSTRAAREAAMAALLQRLARGDGTSVGSVESIGERLREAFGESRSALEANFERLRDADLPTRLMLVQFLGLVGLPECVLPILEAGRDEALAEVVRASLQGMGGSADQAIDAAWDDLDSDLRAAGCGVLALGSTDRGASRLREALEAPDPELRVAAAVALGTRRCGPALPELMSRLERLDEDDPDWQEEHDALVAALAALGEPEPDGAGLAAQTIELMAARREGSSPAMRFSIAVVLGEIGSHDCERDAALVSALLRDPSPRVRRAAVRTLARLAPGRARELLRLSLADESPVVRVAVASALGASDEAGVLEDLRALLQDDDARARAAALRAIGEHCAVHESGGAEQGIALAAAALGDHCLVALEAVGALDRIGGDAAARAACAVLGRSEVELLQAAARCLGRHASSATLGELLPLLPHESWMLRAEVIQILGERRFQQGVPAILRSLETEQHDFVREAILGALKRLED